MVRLQDSTGENWDEFAKMYRQLSTGTTIRPIVAMLEKSNALWPFSRAAGVLDNGSGPGPVMSQLLQDYELPESSALVCSDFSDGMIAQVEQAKQEAVRDDAGSAWKRVETVVQDAMDMRSVEDASKSHVTAGFVYFMTPDPQKCLRESKRVLRDGGVLACTSWQGSQWLTLMRLLGKLRPDKDGLRLPAEWSEASALTGELEKAGFRDVKTYQVDAEFKFERLETTVEFFLTRLPHMTKALEDMPEEERVQLKGMMMEEGRKMCPQDPGVMKGVALVAVGRK